MDFLERLVFTPPVQIVSTFTWKGYISMRRVSPRDWTAALLELYAPTVRNVRNVL